ncbi:MAG: M48 family metallopeptidase [Candidatus Thermoplasmatota archaeon]|nr:M48 family metallopeptidase [Candidatus Thermoplasmatota archaeon]
MPRAPPPVTVLRSRRRKKTIQAKYGKDGLLIYLPAGMSHTEEKKWIDRMVQRNQRWLQRQRERQTDSWLTQRAAQLNTEYFNGELEFSISFVSNQRSRFGSCTSLDKTIRISEKVSSMPAWVQDYIILHELTHLVYPDHSPQFWEVVNRYRYAERAKGYLIALGHGSDE